SVHLMGYALFLRDALPILVLRIAILVLLWAMAAAWPAEGQPALRHRFGFGIGLGHDAQKDELVSPLRYSGLLVPFHFEYSFRGRSEEHTSELQSREKLLCR